jgi:UDP-N-acetylglucosamine transferase subunit ALG13
MSTKNITNQAKVFIVFGNNPYHFSRLFSLIEAILNKPEFQITVQAGSSKQLFSEYEENHKVFDSISNSDFDSFIESADCIISHAGFGILQKARDYNKPVFALPRDPSRLESIDCQSELFEVFESLGCKRLDFQIIEELADEIKRFQWKRSKCNDLPRNLKAVLNKARVPLLVASPGGHADQIVRLSKISDIKDAFFVSSFPRGCFCREIIINNPHRSPLRFLKLFWIAYKLLRRVRPDLVVSTGAGICLPFFLLGSILNINLVYIESASRRHKISLTLRLIRLLRLKVSCYVQSPGLAARYGYPLVDIFDLDLH